MQESSQRAQKVAKASSMPLRRCETNASEEGKIGDEMQVEQRQKLAKEVVVSSRVQKRRAPHSCELATPDLG